MLCVTIIKLMDAMAKCATISSQPANRRYNNPFRPASSIANRPDPEINSTSEISRTDS